MGGKRFLSVVLTIVLIFSGLTLADYTDGNRGALTVYAADYGTDYLSGVNLDLYYALREAVEKIASGETSDSTVNISLSYSCSELGVRNSREAEMYIRRTLDTSLVLDYLLYDLPFDFYWMDKTSSIALDMDVETDRDSVTVSASYGFVVSEEYQGEDSATVDASMVEYANTAIEYAQEIVDKYADESDYDKLVAYRDEICGLVSYESDCEDVSYGNIWQLIWVFDQDDSTNVVCEGYAKAFQYLCDLSSFEADVECYTITGYLSWASVWGTHMWNLLRVDGETYFVDLTNYDDHTEEEGRNMFMSNADDAYAISSRGYPYAFELEGVALQYTYDSLILSMYSSDVLALGTGTFGDEETEAESEAETESETETETETEDVSETETETESGTETENKSETESETVNETETGAGTESESETEAGSETETESETETDSETKVEVETESKTETEDEAETETEEVAESETEAMSESEAENETESETESESETETDSEMETETETETEAQTELDSETEYEDEQSKYLLGDVNGDGSINYLDAMTVLRYDAELITLTEDALLAGDVNGDGCVDTLDAILILRYDAGIIEEF